MDQLLGLLKVKIKRGINLAVRDVRTSDPYIRLKCGQQKLKTRVVEKDVNPEWNEELTLSVTDPNMPITLTVYDYDMLSADDKMGDAEFDIKSYVEALKIDNFQTLPEGTVIMKVQPCRTNCLAEESKIIWTEGKVTQNLILRLRNVECGEVELTLNWINVPGAKGLC